LYTKIRSFKCQVDKNRIVKCVKETIKNHYNVSPKLKNVRKKLKLQLYDEYNVKKYQEKYIKYSTKYSQLLSEYI